jgi:putative tricarboxylic transport membrane protein
VLAVSGNERIKTDVLKDVPTLTESGVKLVFVNWRGVLAPPGISAERRDQLIDDLVTMHDSPQWHKTLVKNGWIDTFRTGDDFEKFLVAQDNRVSGTLTKLGLL